MQDLEIIKKILMAFFLISFSVFSQQNIEYLTEKNVGQFATPKTSIITNTTDIAGNVVIDLDEDYSLSFNQNGSITNLDFQISNINRNSSNVLFIYGDGNSITWPRNVTFHNDLVPYIAPNTWNRLHVYGYKDRYVVTKMGDNSEPPSFADLADFYFMVQDGEFVDVSTNQFEFYTGYYEVVSDYVKSTTDLSFSNNLFTSSRGRVWGGWGYYSDRNGNQDFMFGSANSAYSPVIRGVRGTAMYRTYAGGWRNVGTFEAGWQHIMVVSGPNGTPFKVFINGVERYSTTSIYINWSNSTSSPWKFTIGDHPRSNYNYQMGRVHSAYALPYDLPIDGWVWNEQNIRELANIHRPQGVDEL
jgi:hypothetical protein